MGVSGSGGSGDDTGREQGPGVLGHRGAGGSDRVPGWWGKRQGSWGSWVGAEKIAGPLEGGVLEFRGHRLGVTD